MRNTYSLIWSDEALNNLKEIIEYLEKHWTEKEIKKFIQLLEKRLSYIQNNPFLFSESDGGKGLRKSVLSRQTSIFYIVVANQIRIVTVFDNRQNPQRLFDQSHKINDI